MRDDEQLRQYLLGELPEEEQDLLEARLIEDDGLFERAEAVEADLLQEHARGTLTATQRARMRRHLAYSSASRSQFDVVRDLVKVGKEEKPARRMLIGPWMNLSRLQTHALAAAMLAIAALGIWLDRGATRLQKDIEVMASQALPVQELQQKLLHRLWQQQQQRQNRQPTLPGEEMRAEQLKPTPAPEPVVLLFQLALSSLRGTEDPAELRIPALTDRVDIRLPLLAGDEKYSSFLVALRNAAGEELVRRTDLRPVASAEGAALVLPVEAKLLRAGRYVVSVYAESEDNPLGFPEFEVAEPSS